MTTKTTATFTLVYSDGSPAKVGDSMIDNTTGNLMEFRGITMVQGFAYPARGVCAIVIDVDTDTSARINVQPARVGLTVQASNI